MDDPVLIDDAVVVRVEEFLLTYLGHLHSAADRSEHLEFRRIICIVRRSVVRIAVNDDEHLVRLARKDVLAEPGQQDAVIPVVFFREPALQIALVVILFGMDRRFAPVARAPGDVHAGTLEVVRQDLVKLVLVIRLQDGFHPRHGVCGGSIGLQGYDGIPGGIGIRLLPVAIEGEMVLPGRFADDQDTDVAGVRDGRHVRKRDLFHRLALFSAQVAEGIDRIGPGCEETPQHRGVPVDPGPVLHVAEGDGKKKDNAGAHRAQEPLPGAVPELAAEDIDTGDDAPEQHVQDERPGEEARGLGVLRMDDIAHHLVGHEHVIRVHEIEHHGIPEQGERHDALAHETEQVHQQVVQQEVQDQQQDGCADREDDAVRASLQALPQLPEEGPVEHRHRKYAQRQAPDGQAGLFLEQAHPFRYFHQRPRVATTRPRTRRLYRTVRSQLMAWGSSLKGLSCTDAS